MKTVITIPRDARVFLLEDSEERINWFLSRISNITIRSTANEAVDVLVANPPFDVVFLDHDLGILDVTGNCKEGTGKQVAKHLAATGFLGKNVVIHSINRSGAATMSDILKGATVIPFGSFEIKYD